jgi:thioredoxin 1
MKQWILGIILSGLLAASAAHADRVQVYSVQGVDCASCGNAIKAGLKKLQGVKKSEFDINKVELTVTMDDRVSDDAVLNAIAHSGKGFKGFVGRGKGAYLPFEKYPKGADVVVLTENGGAVGPLEKLRVGDKYTVFDVYADWCGPCRVVDAQLRELTEHRKDIAVRKLNVVDFKSPLAREMGAKLKALPHVVVFSPDGKRTDLTGADAKKLAAAVGTR